MSLSENGLVAIVAQSYVWIASVKKGTWVRKYSCSYLFFINFNFDPSSGSQLETNFGVLEFNLQEDIEEPRSTGTLEELDSQEHWDLRKWGIYRIGSDAWLVKDSRRILRLPGQSVSQKSFSLQTDSKSGMASVVMVHDDCLFRICVSL
ncbi:hypothetical protein NXS19_010754 [Fusarium pseudograminearum]|nr:hypothetical protein NXS19_010754 [Fusarium pseudograminearum]